MTSLMVGLLVAGCGSSSKSSSSATTASITKPEFLAKANAICIAGNKKTNAEGKALGNSPTGPQVIRYVTVQAVPEIQSQINAIRALGAPSGDQAKVASMLDLAQADLNKLKKSPTLLLSNRSPFHDFAVIAHPYGLTACAPNA